MTTALDNQTLTKRLAAFGLRPDLARLYTLLLQAGPSGIVAITRATQVGRNMAYRLLAELEERQLVSVSEKSFGKEYLAADPAIFERVVADREEEAVRLRDSLLPMVAGLQAFTRGEHGAKIVHYKGVEGLKQVNWNLTKAKKEFLVFELAPLSDSIEPSYAEKLRSIWRHNKITTYDITNRKSIDSYTKDLEFWKKYSKYRYIPKSILNIKFEMCIYNDVVTLLDYKAAEPHCVEIYDQYLAGMQLQLFEALWRQATPMKTDPVTNRRYVEKQPQ